MFVTASTISGYEVVDEETGRPVTPSLPFAMAALRRDRLNNIVSNHGGLLAAIEESDD